MATKAEEKKDTAEVKAAEETKKDQKPEEMETDAKEEEKKENGDDKGEEEEAQENGEKKPDGPKPFKYRNSFNATAEEHENSPYLWIRTKSLMTAVNTDLEKTQNALTELFADRFQVAIPKLKLPVTQHLFVEMQSKEDKRKVLEESDQPERWGSKKFNDNKKPTDNPAKIITQSIAVREEKWASAEKGTLEEALDSFLPRRNVLYKDQLVEKAKELDETLEEVVTRSNEAFSKNNRYVKKPECVKPPVEDIVPMVPNVGYERNISIDLEKDARGKIQAGVRVLYEKDEKNKQFLLPLSECSNVAPQIIKAAEAAAAFLTEEKFDVYDGVKNPKDIYSLKFTMNEIGEIIMTLVLVIDDKFTDEFYDVCNKENTPQGVLDYFAKVAARPKNQEKKEKDEKKEEKKDDEEGGDDAEVPEEEADAAVEEPDVAANGEGDKANGDEKPEDALVIIREGFQKPLTLGKTPIRRIDSQIREHVEKYSPALKKFFEEKCTPLGVVGIYITWYAANKRPTEWNRKDKHWYHVAGSQSVTETINSVKLELFPYQENYHPQRTQTIPTIMNTVVDGLGLDANSQVIVACDYHFVQNYFAQKCKKTAALSFMQETLRNDLKEKHKDKITFLSARNKQINIFEKAKRHFTGDVPHAVIHWGQFSELPIKHLYQHRPKKVAWVVDAREDNVNFGPNKPLNADLLKRNNMMLYPHFTLKKVIGLDVGPQKSGQITLVAFYEATTGPIQMTRPPKRKTGFQQGGPNAKRNFNQRGPGGQNQMRRGPGGPGGPMRGGRGPGGPGGFQRSRRGGGPQPLMRGPGPRGPPVRGPMGPGGRPPHPWGDNRRDGYDRPYDRPAAAPDQTVQAASAVLSQLNTIIENQLLLAQMGGPRSRGGAAGGGGYGGPSQGRDDFGPRQIPDSGFGRDLSPTGGGFGGVRDDFRSSAREDFTRDDDAFGPSTFGSTGRDSFGSTGSFGTGRKDYGFSTGGGFGGNRSSGGGFGGANRNSGGGFGGANRNSGGGFGGGNRNGGNRNSGGAGGGGGRQRGGFNRRN